ncbi:exopolyphosphatase-like isoform X1 [Phoenix dactylifera]|uniref:Exopolyphosphatase-like isoform X1 n=1 Tax=Phoenix dactylifera TaxID=42345 RepID=A0A8B9APU9_PHODC|nr:exopolyphosphatase-like isoform X1 [Phoenix dactylifera]
MEAATAPHHRLLAAVDVGTNSFKLLVACALPSGRLLALDRLKEPVLLGRGRLPDGSLSPDTLLRALAALRSFDAALRPLPLHGPPRLVATSAVRDAPNRADLLSIVRSDLGLDVEVLSGEEEARLIYLGVLQFLPVYGKSVLTVDIGGGSTEFVVGKRGEVQFATSLNLGHVSLTESFIKNGTLVDLRRHIRSALRQSPLIKIRELGFEVAVGSSGTIRSIERAIFLSGYDDLMSSREFSREWRFSREDLRLLVDKLLGLGLGDVEGVRRLGFSKKRGEFIVAGGVLLLEIFEALGIENMEVSGYALGEGVISEMLASECMDFDVNANVRWQSVIGLAMRFDSDNRMKLAARCVGIAKELFDGIRRCGDLTNCLSKAAICLDEKDFEYLEAAILLHNIGLLIDKKGYHKRSYKIIKNGGHLHGYSSEEIEIVALLARFHRKKFPRADQGSLKECSEEMKKKIRVLCAIMRISLALQKCQCVIFQGLEIFHTGGVFKLVLSKLKDHLLVSHDVQLKSETIEAELRPELDHFKEVFQQKICVTISSANIEKSAQVL